MQLSATPVQVLTAMSSKTTLNKRRTWNWLDSNLTKVISCTKAWAWICKKALPMYQCVVTEKSYLSQIMSFKTAYKIIKQSLITLGLRCKCSCKFKSQVMKIPHSQIMHNPERVRCMQPGQKCTASPPQRQRKCAILTESATHCKTHSVRQNEGKQNICLKMELSAGWGVNMATWQDVAQEM